MASKDVVVYSAPTPNGLIVPIFLEELKAAYGSPDYDFVKMSIRDADIGKVHNQVKADWFLEINPNGRIPAITHKGQRVFETSAVLVYLAEFYDKERKFSQEKTKDAAAWAEEQSWIFFSHGGVGPMQGQANFFKYGAPEPIPYAIERYLKETKRLYSVLESHFAKHQWLAGEQYGIADLKTWGWLHFAPRTGVELSEFPNLDAWVKRIDERPATKAGLAVFDA